MSGEPPSRAEARRARLEEELRENLRRRKEQARARRARPGEDAPAEAGDPDADAARED
ncbi:hypothetical protein [Aureimonas endophytica]|uniref:hypothetical protein n=1 Tax=Aureimonas endophytica TaxID=2027858 RepID=UPI0016675D2C|nr:hypothetical protein [Aureimonas endophytica]